MANINENRKLMVEQMNKIKAQLSEAKAKLPVKDEKGQRIIQAIRNNYPLIDVRTLKKRGEFDKDEIGKTAEVILPVLRNGVKAALAHKYQLHPDIADKPSDTHKDYWRFNSKKQMQDSLDKTIKGLKELSVMIDSAMKKPSIAALTKIGDFCNELLWTDAGPNGYFGAHILKSGGQNSSFI